MNLRKIAVLFAVGVSGCFAQQRAGTIRQRHAVEPDAEPRRLGEVLPASLSAFVERAGSDRSLSSDELESLAALAGQEEPDPHHMIAVLKPVAVLTAHDWVVFLPESASSGVSVVDRRNQPLLIAGGMVTADDGRQWTLGDVIPLETAIVGGLVLNAGTVGVFAESGTNQALVQPGEVVLIGCAMSCEVSCSNGFFACCVEENNCAKCVCVKDDDKSLANCDGGGKGATSCSATVKDRELVPMAPSGRTEP